MEWNYYSSRIYYSEYPGIQEKLIALFELKDTPNQSENSSSSSDYEDNNINELESDSSE